MPPSPSPSLSALPPSLPPLLSLCMFICLFVCHSLSLSLPFPLSPSPLSLSLSLLVVQVIEMVKGYILPHASKLPQKFLEQLTMVLNRGSIHSATDSTDGKYNDYMFAHTHTNTHTHTHRGKYKIPCPTNMAFRPEPNIVEWIYLPWGTSCVRVFLFFLHFVSCCSMAGRDETTDGGLFCCLLPTPVTAVLIKNWEEGTC